MLAARTTPFAPSAALIAALEAAYATPPRAYHHLGHIADVLADYDQLAWHQPIEVFVAIAFHDAIYEAGRPDNERRSAQLARATMPAAQPDVAVELDRVAQLIELTARHGNLTPADVAGDADAAQFLDCDMAILAAPAADYDRYERAIADEYRAVPAAAYRAGRAAFLDRVLATPRIYLGDGAHARLDARARTNLARARAALG